MNFAHYFFQIGLEYLTIDHYLPLLETVWKTATSLILPVLRFCIEVKNLFI